LGFFPEETMDVSSEVIYFDGIFDFFKLNNKSYLMMNALKLIRTRWVFLIFIFMMVFSCKDRTLQEIEPSGFTSPPDSVRIYAWWHWMVNAISREGITRDLEAMKEQGIAGATILNVGDIMEEKDYGVPQVIFGTDEWFGMFHWALQEAERLGITIGAHNCDGWSTSGGPWITPETSMKSIIWSKSILQGSKPVDTLLLKPSGRMDYYEDVAVIAYRITGTPNSFQQENPHISLNDMEVRSLYDGSPVSGIEIQKNENVLIEFSSPFPAGKLLIHPRVVFSWSEVENIGCDFSLSASDDGKYFRPVVSFRTTGVNKNQEVSIPHTEARFYSLKLENSSESSIEITELELLGSNENPLYNPAIAHHMDKIVSSKPIGGSSMFETSGGKASEFWTVMKLWMSQTTYPLRAGSPGSLRMGPGKSSVSVIPQQGP
jgi:hypothetical protein